MKITKPIAVFFKINEVLSKISGGKANFKFGKARNVRIIQEAIDDFLKSIESSKPSNLEELVNIKEKTPEQLKTLKDWEETVNNGAMTTDVELEVIEFKVEDLGDDLDDKYFQVIEMFIA